MYYVKAQMPEVFTFEGMHKGSYFVTGIGTDVGKTVISAVLAKTLEADYWKPVQCGDLTNTDTMKVQRLAGCKAHYEAYKLALPMSPHAAAEAEGIAIELERFSMPVSKRPVIVEGAGGIMVPLNGRHTMVDLMKRLQLPAILVSRNYLGSINHTLMSLELLKSHGLEVAGVLFSGEEVPSSEDIIAQLSEVRVLGRVPWIEDLTATGIAAAAKRLRNTFNQVK